MKSRELLEWRKIIAYLKDLNATTVQSLHRQRAKHDPNIVTSCESSACKLNGCMFPQACPERRY